MRKSSRVAALSVAGILLSAVTPMASAIDITPTSSNDAIIAALFGGGGAGIDESSITISISSQTNNGDASIGTYTNDSGIYGVGNGIVISSGDVNDYNDGPNNSTGNTTSFGVAATADQELLLDPITGGSFDHNDVTQIDITFDLMAGFDTVFFNVVFGSDEYDEFVNSTFIDAFGLYVNGTNIAFANGEPINIDHPDMAFVSGTELDGILGGSTGEFGPYVHTFSSFVGDGATGITLTFIIADSGDSALDSTAFISQLGGSLPPEEPGPGPDPEPTPIPIAPTWALFLLSGWLLKRVRKAA